MNKQAVGPMIFALMVAAAAPAAGGTTYYVNGACGDDAWSGLSPDCAATGGPKATIQAGIDAASDGDIVIVAPSVYHERIDFLGKAVALQSSDGPEVTVIDAERTGRVVQCTSGEGPDTLLEGFTITGGFTDGTGGGMSVVASSPTVRNCVIKDNEANHSGGMIVSSGGSPLIDACTFIDNWTVMAAGALTVIGGHPIIKDCLFRDNDAGLGDGALVITHSDGISPLVVNCRFMDNSGVMAGGAIDGGDTVFVNCVFSDNVPGALVPGALVTVGFPTVINCTFSDNTGYGIFTDGGLNQLVALNSILWGNSEGSVGGDGATIYFSDVEGGWSGPGGNNIDADPLFVQPGVGNVRLAFGSPCVNAGDNTALPDDVLDLDGDGDTSELIPFDVAGIARIQGSVVDMGAYEGEFEPMPSAECASDIDRGERVILVPGGGDFDPLASAAVIVRNHSGSDDATFVVTQIDWDPHPGAGGFSELSAVLNGETSLADGEYRAIFFVPFDFDDVTGGDILDVDLTCYDPVAGNWALAVAGNTAPSPGYGTQYGDRIVSGPSQGWGITNELGDYGVYLDPFVQRGFVWAAVDRCGEFGVGIAYCRADCRQTPDGMVGVGDFLALLATWGGAAGNGPCDLEGNGIVDEADFVALLAAWGPCPQNAAPPREGWTHLRRERGARAATASMRSADLDGNGVVGRPDLLILRDVWGPCAGCPADLDGDGRVGVADLLALTAEWN